MGYPGDQGKPGGWPTPQPPQAPYGPGAGRPEAAPYGNDNDETPFAARDEGHGGQPPGGPSPSGTDPFGALGGPPGPTGWGDEPVAGQAPDEDPFAAPMDGGFGGTPPGPPGPAGPPGPSDGLVAPERRRNLPLIIGGAVAAGLVLIGGGVGLSSVLKDDSKPKAAEPSPTVSTPQPKPSPAVAPLDPVKLKSRSTDPKALTLSEVFGKATFKGGKQKYVRTAVNAKRGCTGVVGGVTLTKALKKGGCAQALRATYALGTGKLIGTVGVLNLRTEAAAKQAVKAAGAKDAFLQALPGKGVSKNNGKGEALGTSEAFGHYVIMTWVQRPDGKKIEAKYHATVRAFGTQIVKGSGLSLALHYRETEGKPLQK
ncbi:hypothetical protein [Actinomadura rubrisoli]|uniref:Uncharacterized protein n=1 Tax=Actinomadura rubrisoli TaxID=2530368 RepID=A0A4R4ZRB5_9ACTN|nr:hypothetical protein [Actinomadura rubrisoli]TDD59522.1 hypothetical protein E1298_46580 [Actinomadura rubrisoli]